MTEMDKLDAALTEMGIEHTYDKEFQNNGAQIVVTENGEYLWDAICTSYSYGGAEGLLEVMGEPLLGNGNDVQGCLTAEGVLWMMKGGAQCT